MGSDEERTLARLNAPRREFLYLQIRQFGGRIVKSMGDRTLDVFYREKMIALKFTSSRIHLLKCKMILIGK